MLIDPSTVNVIPVQTWAVVIVQSPEITPTWSQMPARFINRLPSDYLSRYGLVLAQENEAFAWRNYYYSLTSMEITKLGQKWAQISSIFVVRAACARRIDGSDGTAQITFFLSTFLTLTGVFLAPLSSSLASRWPQA